jgi:hypothetical protein
MHRLLLVRISENPSDRFRVVADSGDPSVSENSSRSIADAGGTDWEEFDDSTGYSSPYATVPCDSVVSSLGYWFVNKTGNVLDYDFAAAGLSERKVITSGELHVECDGRRYVATSGDSMIFLLDPEDRTPDGSLRPFPVRFLGDHECTVVYTEYVLPS